MACVWYACNDCSHMWIRPSDQCPQCGSTNFDRDWDEANDYAHEGEHLEPDTFEYDGETHEHEDFF